MAVPALILTGDRDPFAALEQTVALLRRLPEAELAVIPGAGHGYDERFTAAALQFLERHVAPGRPQPAQRSKVPPPHATSVI